MARQDEAVHDAASRRLDGLPGQQVAARTHRTRRMAQGAAPRAALHQQLALLQRVPEELRVVRRRRGQPVAHDNAARSGANLRMRKVWRPTTSPRSSRYVVTHVTKWPRPIRVCFSSDTDSISIVEVMTSPRRR